MNFKAQGVLSVSVEADKTTYLLRPSPAYLSASKNSVVMYGIGEGEAQNIKQAELRNGVLGLELNEKLLGKEAFLFQLAMQQRPVELRINKDGNEIIGFTYPAPKP